MGGSKKNNKLIGLVLCIPLAFIAYFALTYISQASSLSDVESVFVTTPVGAEFSYDDSVDISVYVDMLKDARSISTPIRNIDNEDPIVIEYTLHEKSEKYRLYPQLNLSGCMIKDSESNYYLLSEDSVKTLLTRTELQYLYESYYLPAIKVTSGGDEAVVYPVSYDWQYKKADGNYYRSIQDDNNPEAIGIYSIYPEMSNSLAFTLEPDEMSTSLISEKGEVLTLSDISTISYDSDTVIAVEISAKWNGLDGAEYKGEAFFRFNILYDKPASLSLETTEYTKGEVAVVMIENLNEDENVSLNTTLSTSALTTFKSESITYALLPIPDDETDQTVGYSMSFTITSASTGKNSVFNKDITVKAGSGTVRTILEVDDEDYDRNMTDELLARVAASLEEALSSASDDKFFEFGNSFSSPPGALVDSFGKKLIFGSRGTFYLRGNIYSAQTGTTVKSSQRGIVSLAESLPVLGNTVVVDHGYGIKTIYSNLSDIKCNTGDIVEKDQIIGETGSTGFTNGGEQLFYGVSVNGQLVNPYDAFTGFTSNE